MGGVEALRVQWFQARARMIQSRNVSDFLREELRRVISSFQLRARWWESQVTQNLQVYADYQEGAKAFVCRQAFLRRSMERRCFLLWRSVKNWMRRPLRPSRLCSSEDVSRSEDGVSNDADTLVESG